MVNDGVTGGYDIVFQLEENFIDKLLAAAFYTTKYMRVQGTMELLNVLPDKPEILVMSEFTEVIYDVRVKEPPTIDAFQGNVVRILINLDVFLNILGGIPIELDSAVFADAKISFDNEGIFLDLKNAKIDMVYINDNYKFSKKAIKQFNMIIEEIIREKLLVNYGKIKLPIVPFSSKLDDNTLPYMPKGKNEISVSIGDPEEDGKGFALALNNLKTLNENRIALCMNLMGYDGGDITKISVKDLICV